METFSPSIPFSEVEFLCIHKCMCCVCLLMPSASTELSKATDHYNSGCLPTSVVALQARYDVSLL